MIRTYKKVRYPTPPHRSMDGRWNVKYIRAYDKGAVAPIFGNVYAESRDKAEEKAKELIERYGRKLRTDVTASYRNVAEPFLLNELLRFDGDIGELERSIGYCSENIELLLTVMVYVGIPFSQACALKFGDFDAKNREIRISLSLSKNRSTLPRFNVLKEKKLPLPLKAVELYIKISKMFSADSYLITGTSYPARNMAWASSIVRYELGVGKDFGIDSLQSIFVKRMIENGMSPKLVEIFTSISEKTISSKYTFDRTCDSLRTFAGFDDIKMPNCVYSAFSNSTAKKNTEFKLLIVTDGSNDSMVRRIAEDSLLFEFIEVMYLADEETDSELLSFYGELYPFAVPAIEDAELRKKITELLEEKQFMIPRLIHPSANVSPAFTKLERGCIIDKDVTVNSKTIIGKGTVIKKGMSIEEGSVVAEFSNIG